MLAYKAGKGHLLFYEDGEDEWVDLGAQGGNAVWQEPDRAAAPATAGLPKGGALHSAIIKQAQRERSWSVDLGSGFVASHACGKWCGGLPQ